MYDVNTWLFTLNPNNDQRIPLQMMSHPVISEIDGKKPVTHQYETYDRLCELGLSRGTSLYQHEQQPYNFKFENSIPTT